MPVTTFTVNVGIPIFALGFTAQDELVIGGGGGSGRTGVTNKVVSSRLTLECMPVKFIDLRKYRQATK
jgi:hypothetical protein